MREEKNCTYKNWLWNAAQKSRWHVSLENNLIWLQIENLFVISHFNVQDKKFLSKPTWVGLMVFGLRPRSVLLLEVSDSIPSGVSRLLTWSRHQITWSLVGHRHACCISVSIINETMVIFFKEWTRQCWKALKHESPSASGSGVGVEANQSSNFPISPLMGF